MVETSPRHSERELIQLGKQVVVFFGPEGCGKTIQAQRLSQISNKPLIVLGDIIRDLAINDKTKYGDEARKMFAENRYYNTDLLPDVQVDRFKQSDTASGFILDGGLRQVDEVKSFLSVLKRANRQMQVSVVHLRLPGWQSIERLVTGNSARRRDDRDSLEGVLSRLTKYYTDLGARATLIKQQENWRLLHVDATNDADKVFIDVCTALQSNPNNPKCDKIFS